MKKILISIMILSSALCGCSELWRDYQNLQPDGGQIRGGRNKGPGAVTGVVPVSGSTLKTVLDNGLSLLSFPDAVSNRVLGSVNSGKAYPDLFFQCSDGDGNQKVYLCTYQETVEGKLVYSAPAVVSFPWSGTGACVKVISIGGTVYGLAMDKLSMKGYVYDSGMKTFASTPAFTMSVSGIVNSVFAFDMVPSSGDEWTVYVLTDDGSVYLPDVPKEHTIYNSANLYIGNLPHSRLYSFSMDASSWQCKAPAAQISGTVEDFIGPAALLRLTEGWLVGTCLGGIGWVQPDGDGKVKMLAATDGSALDNRCVLTRIAPMDGTSFVASGDGPVYYYAAGTTPAADGRPSYLAPAPLMMRSGELYAGSCSVPNVADWDRDGVLDIVSGTSDGRIAFFKNYGTNEAPAFGEPCFLQADGQEVCIRSGYYDLGGPLNAAYGFLGPTVIDWNGDGIPDIVYSSNAMRTGILLGTGKPAPDCLKSSKVLNADGIDLWGRWKVRPALTRYNGEVWLANLDTDDVLHLYWKGSATNVHDCGPILLVDGSAITGHRMDSDLTKATEQGDVKMQFTDWDGDGDPDLLVGTTSVASFPNSYQGMPWNLGTQNMQIMIFENISTDGRFVFEYPRLFQYLRMDLYLGPGAKAPVSCELGDSRRGPNMLVGSEDGKFRFFTRQDLSEKKYW